MTNPHQFNPKSSCDRSHLHIYLKETQTDTVGWLYDILIWCFNIDEYKKEQIYSVHARYLTKVYRDQDLDRHVQVDSYLSDIALKEWTKSVKILRTKCRAQF